jgi:acetolactate synthase-1/2/3 large subunit
MKVSDFIANELVGLGVTHVFTLPGGYSQNLNDSIAHTPGLTPVYMLHESGAGFAAVNYAAYSGKLGVAVVTSGPGCTNILTAVASAYQDSVPLLVISGEANVQNVENRRKFQLRQGGPQDVEIEKIARPITKYIDVAENGIGAKWILSQAVKYALQDRRGPVWVIVPLDVQGMECAE